MRIPRQRAPHDDREDRERRAVAGEPLPDVSDGEPVGGEDPARDAVARLQRTAGNAAVTRAVDPGAGPARAVAERLIPGAGRRLDPGVRGALEDRLGVDLRGLRVHTGPGAARAADAVGARAFTAGRHVVFAEGAFDPASARGRTLLAHEAVHVAQQAGGPAATAPQAEAEARDAGRRVADGERAGRPVQPGAPLQADMDDPAREGWRAVARAVDADEEAAGPVVLAEGLHATATRTQEALRRTEPLIRDERERSRVRRAGAELVDGEDELPDLVQEVEPGRLPEIAAALEQVTGALDEIERIAAPAEERARHGRELMRVAKGAERLQAALPAGRWRARVAAVADLAGVARDVALAPVAAAGGGDGEGGDGVPAPE
ncbi:MAG: DUF4157 domain-containing protein [Actinomycetota bacterium]